MDDFLHGPAFVSWLEARRIEPSGNWVRRFYDWRRGSAVTLQAADEFLIAHTPYLLSHLPDEMWREDPRKHNRVTRVHPELKQKVIQAKQAGGSTKAIAEQYGVSQRAVLKWAA